jgi:hypothetical protein
MSQAYWDHYSDLPAPMAYMEKPFITLSKAQWRDIHNALCAVESQTRTIADVLKQGTELHDRVEALREALAPAYQQENDQWDQHYADCENVKTLNGFDAIWSAEDVDFDQPHPFASDAVIVYQAHWGEVKDRHYPITGPTWLDVYRAADLAMRESGDGHHVFIEGFSPQSDNTVQLHTGS